MSNESTEPMLEVVMERDKETKNTVRFQEVTTDEPPVLETLYIKKYALKKLGDPERIRVTVWKEA